MTGAPSRHDGLSPIVCSYTRTEMVANEVLLWTDFFGFMEAGSNEMVRWIEDDGILDRDIEMAADWLNDERSY